MEVYKLLLQKIRLNLTDKYICNYLLTDKFVASNLDSIHQTLIEKYIPSEAYELIICALYSIDVRVHVIKDHCPGDFYEKHKSKLNREKLLYVRVYRDCTDENLIIFMKFIFNKTVTSVSSKDFFEFLSNENQIQYDDILRGNIDEFYSQNIGSAIEVDGKPNLKRKKLQNGEDKIKTYEIKENRDNLCLIFNDDERMGSEQDVNIINSTFLNLRGFSVKDKSITTVGKLKQDISDFCQQVSDNCDMIVCFIMCHGDETSIISQGQHLPYQEILTLFENKFAPKLEGKPKVIVFQTCRGEEFQAVYQCDSPNPPNSNPTMKQTPAPIKRLVINHCDFFVIFATVHGCRAMRNKFTGACFIQAFCRIIRDSSKMLTVDQMCTRLNEKNELFHDEDKVYTQLCEVQKVLRKDNIYLEN